MLELQNASLFRGTQILFENASLTIFSGKHVGITGMNGTGKSSLFMLILKQLELETGLISLPSNLVLAHVSQDVLEADLSAINYVLKGDAELYNTLHQLELAEQKGRHDEIAHLHMKLDELNGYAAKSKAAKLLIGLGFTQQQFDHPVNSFSGGWQMRLNLARALMTRSDMLLLDEPTNHLDLDAVIWLEEYLKSYAGTLLLISHDRAFLDSVVDQILHISQKQLSLYNGNFSEFERQRSEKLALQQAGFEKQQKQIQHMQQFISRFKAKATKAKQAQSRIKALEKLTLIAPAHVDTPFSFSFHNAENLPHTLLALEDASIGYAAKDILHNINLQIFAGDRLGVLGANGQGKSTLIKTLAGELELKSGSRNQNKHTKIGYFAQHQLSQLNSEYTAIETFRKLDKNASEQQLLNYLGGFNFSGDKTKQKIASFSGGEKARLVLACIVYQKPNLLLLDEPTNHLDLDMRDALNLALQSYNGALIVISHDRHLLNTVCDRFLLVANGSIRDFEGDLDDYRLTLKQFQEEIGQNDASGKERNSISKKERRQQDAELRKQIQPLKNKLKSLDRELTKLNNQKSELDAQLNDNSIYGDANKDKLKQILQKHNEIKNLLEETEEQWLEVSEKIEVYENNG